jgi:hypothetical protein
LKNYFIDNRKNKKKIGGRKGEGGIVEENVVTEENRCLSAAVRLKR